MRNWAIMSLTSRLDNALGDCGLFFTQFKDTLLDGHVHGKVTV